VYHQCLMRIFDVNTSTPLKIEKLQGTLMFYLYQNAFFLHFCSTPVKIEKLDPALLFPDVGLFYLFRGYYILYYIYILYNNIIYIIYIIYTFKYYIIYYIRCLEEASDWRYSDFWIPVLFPHSSCQATGAQDGCGRSLDNAFGSSHVLVLSWRT
jgi:hypothetical protein